MSEMADADREDKRLERQFDRAREANPELAKVYDEEEKRYQDFRESMQKLRKKQDVRSKDLFHAMSKIEAELLAGIGVVPDLED